MKSPHLFIMLGSVALVSGCLSIGDISEPTNGGVALPGQADEETKVCIDKSSVGSVALLANHGDTLDIPSFNAKYLNLAIEHGNQNVRANADVKALDSLNVVHSRRFAAFVKARSGKPVTAAAENSTILAQQLLENESIHSEIRALSARAAGVFPDTEANLRIDREKLADYSDELQTASANNGFLLAAIGYSYLLSRENLLNIAAPEESSRFLRIYRLYAEASFLDVYLKAYFRDGKIISARFDSADLRKKLIEKIDRQIPPANPGGEAERTKLVEELADNVIESILGGKPQDGAFYNLIGEIGETSFVSRGGVAYQFPGITIDVNPLAENRVDSNEIDYTVVGSDIVRVAIEAIGDSWSRLPAAANSTACKHDLLSCWDSDKDTDKIFSKVNSVANKSEAIAGAATGRLIRGISWFSLNNEALAELLETAVGVAVRKGSEKLAWCYYESKPQELKYADTNDPTFENPSSIRILMDAPRTD